MKEIRKMTSEDIAQVSKLYKYANPCSSLSDIKKWTLKGLKENPELNYVFEKDLKIYGAISAVINKKKAEIYDVAVFPKFRNNKIGSKLLKLILNKIKSKKINNVELFIHWQNARAITFYYKFGFKINKISITKDVPGIKDGTEIIHLYKEIN